MVIRKNSIKYSFQLLTALIVFTSSVYGQDIIPFASEVAQIVERNDSIWDKSKETIVFTGSSSIRLWNDIQERFPNKQIINTGFGGSQAVDLNQHLDELVLRFNPKQVFIYEGDNDVFNKKKPKIIVNTIRHIVNRLTLHDKNRKVVLISAKPSLSRWKLRRKYSRLNKKFEKFANQYDQVFFVDVWHPMLNGRKVKSDIFIEDGLHMNAKGYEIWYDTLKEYIK